MKTRPVHVRLLLVAGVILTTACSFKLLQPQMAKFVAPASANALKNPLKGNATSIEDGKKLYNANCVPCHGAKGKGDGEAAAALAKPPADHTSTSVQGQTDGALFWMITEGNTPMPAYKTVFTESQRWSLVNYIRTLAKPAKK